MSPRSGDEVREFGTQHTRALPNRRLSATIAQLLSLATLLLTTACTSLSKPYPAKESFGLTTPAITPATQRHDAVLRVERVRVAAPYDARSFVYRLSDTRYQPDYYNEFVTEPERLLTAELVRSLTSANAFSTVVEPGAGVPAKLRLETSVSEFYGDYRDPAAPRAVIRARFLLLEDRLDSTAVIAEWNLESREALTAGEPAALADAWSLAWAKVIDQLVTAISSSAISR